MVGKVKYRQKIRTATKDADLCTVADEAFAHLVLRNNFARWEDIHSQKKKEGYLSARQKALDERETDSTGKLKRARIFESNTPPLWTDAGLKFSDRKKQRFKGWSVAGLKAYNIFYDQVKKDRKENEGFFEKFLEYLKKKNKTADDSNPNDSNDGTITKLDHVVPRNELFSDDEETESEEEAPQLDENGKELTLEQLLMPSILAGKPPPSRSDEKAVIESASEVTAL